MLVMRCSTASRTRVVTRTYSTFSDRAFAAAGPGLWSMEQSVIAPERGGLIVQQILAVVKDIFVFGQCGHGAV